MRATITLALVLSLLMAFPGCGSKHKKKSKPKHEIPVVAFNPAITGDPSVSGYTGESGYPTAADNSTTLDPLGMIFKPSNPTHPTATQLVSVFPDNAAALSGTPAAYRRGLTQLPGGGDPALQSLAGQFAASEVRVLMDYRKRILGLDWKNLPPAPAQYLYQLWVVGKRSTLGSPGKFTVKGRNLVDEKNRRIKSFPMPAGIGSGNGLDEIAEVFVTLEYRYNPVATPSPLRAYAGLAGKQILVPSTGAGSAALQAAPDGALSGLVLDAARLPPLVRENGLVYGLWIAGANGPSLFDKFRVTPDQRVIHYNDAGMPIGREGAQFPAAVNLVTLPGPLAVEITLDVINSGGRGPRIFTASGLTAGTPVALVSGLARSSDTGIEIEAFRSKSQGRENNPVKMYVTPRDLTPLAAEGFCYRVWIGDELIGAFNVAVNGTMTTAEGREAFSGEFSVTTRNNARGRLEVTVEPVAGTATVPSGISLFFCQLP